MRSLTGTRRVSCLGFYTPYFKKMLSMIGVYMNSQVLAERCEKNILASWL
jgi:hypothetical protein